MVLTVYACKYICLYGVQAVFPAGYLAIYQIKYITHATVSMLMYHGTFQAIMIRLGITYNTSL